MGAFELEDVEAAQKVEVAPALVVAEPSPLGARVKVVQAECLEYLGELRDEVLGVEVEVLAAMALDQVDVVERG